MANILITWEIGEGSGHIAPYLNLIKELEARGHEITFTCKYVSRAFRLFEGTRVRYLQAPYVSSPASEQVTPIDSFAKILNNSGYSNVPQLAGMIRAWKNLFELVKPDLIIADYSPTAVLASRESGIPRLQIGTGFYQMPTQGRVPSLAELQGIPQDDPSVFGFQNKILTHINSALELNEITRHNHFIIDDHRNGFSNNNDLYGCFWKSSTYFVISDLGRCTYLFTDLAPRVNAW